jgi:hypothetical protein
MVVLSVIVGLWLLMLVFVVALCRVSARADAVTEGRWRPRPAAAVQAPEKRSAAIVVAGPLPRA